MQVVFCLCAIILILDTLTIFEITRLQIKTSLNISLKIPKLKNPIIFSHFKEVQAVSRTMSDHLCCEWCDLKKSWESRGKVCCTKNQIIKKICWTNLHRIFLHYLIVTTPGAWHCSTNLKLHFSSGRCCWIGGAQQYQGSCHLPCINKTEHWFLHFWDKGFDMLVWFGGSSAQTSALKKLTHAPTPLEK